MHKLEIGRYEFKNIASDAAVEALHDLLGEPQLNQDFVTKMVSYSCIMSRVLSRLEKALFDDDSKEA